MAVRQIGADVVLGGERAFNDAMKGVNSNLKSLRAEMSAVSSEFIGNEKSTEALTAANEKLGEIQDQQRAKMDALAARLDAVKAKTGENSAATDKARTALANATAEYNRTSAAIEKNEEQIEENTKAEKRHIDVLKLLSSAASGAGTAFTATAKGAALLTAAGLTAAGALGVLATQGLKMLSDTLQNGDPRFANLSRHLEHISTAAEGAKSALASSLLPALEPFSKKAAGYLSAMQYELERADPSEMGPIVTKYITKLLKLARDAVPQFMELAGELLGGFGEGIEENLPEILDEAEGILLTLLDGLIAAAPEMGDMAATLITMLVDFLATASPELLTAGVDLITQLVLGLANAAPQLIAKAPELIRQLLSSLVGAAPQLVMAALQLVLALIQGLGDAIPQLLAMVPELIGELIGRFADEAGRFKDIGSNIVEGVKQGLLNAWNGLKSFVGGLFDSLIGGVRAQEGIHSPSTRWAKEVGEPDAEGVGVGFARGMQTVNKEMAEAIDTSFSVGATGQYAGSFGDYGSAGSRVTNMGGIVIQIYAAEGQSEEEVAEAVAYRLQDMLDDKEAS